MERLSKFRDLCQKNVKKRTEKYLQFLLHCLAGTHFY